MARQLHINVNILNAGVFGGSWRFPGIDAADSFTVEHYTSIASKAEAAKLDAIFLADGPVLAPDLRYRPGNNLEPTTVLARIAAQTERIGLIGTLSSSYNDPHELARRVMDLDRISAGRVGWNVVTTAGAAAARNFGRITEPEHALRYRRAAEFVEQVVAQWSSPGSPRSAQDWPVIVQAGGSSDGRRLASRIGEVIFSADQTLDSARAFRTEIRNGAVDFGRRPEDIVILPGLSTVVGSTEKEAWERRELLSDILPDAYARRRLSGQFGFSLRIVDLTAGGAALEGSVAAAYLAGAEPDVGFLVDAPTSHNAPYNLARRLLSIDRATGGRSGLVLRPGQGDAVSELTAPDPAARDVRERWAGNATDESGATVRFTVPTDRDGVEVADDFDAIGQRLTASGTTRLTNVHLDADEVIPADAPSRNPYAGAAATLDQLSGGRLLINIVSGLDNLGAYGDTEAEPARRYDRTREFLQLVRRLWSKENVTFHGECFGVEGSTLSPRLYTTPGRFGGGGAATTWLVGSPGDVAAALRKYRELGVTHFVLSDTPYQQEIARIGDQLLSRLREREPV